MTIAERQAPKHFTLPRPLNNNRDSVLEVLHSHSRLAKCALPDINLQVITKTDDTTVFIDEPHGPEDHTGQRTPRSHEIRRPGCGARRDFKASSKLVDDFSISEEKMCS